MNERSQNDGSQVAPAADLVAGGRGESGNGRWSKSDDLGFELGSAAIPVRLLKGQYVTVKTIWGDRERGIVLGISREAGFPMVELLMDRGDHIYVNVAYCTPEEET